MRVPSPVPWATSHSSAIATCSGVAVAGICSAARTITRTCSTRSRPAANAARVAGYLDSSSRASHSPPAATSRVEPVSAATQASVPVAASRSASARRSASASSARRQDSTCACNATSPVIASATSPSDTDDSPTEAPEVTSSRAASTTGTGTAGAGNAWIDMTPFQHPPPTVPDPPRRACGQPTTQCPRGLRTVRVTLAHRGLNRSSPGDRVGSAVDPTMAGWQAPPRDR